MNTKRMVFFISDGTGITAECLGHCLTAQFEDIEFEQTTLAFVNSLERAEAAVTQINQAYNDTGIKPLVFATLVDPTMRVILRQAQCIYIDFFQAFTPQLEQALNASVSHKIGRSHGVINYESYKTRIDAINYTLNSDDGLGIQNYDQADLILIGVSRCGKTPTSIYLAMHFGLYVANYPLTEDELHQSTLPPFLLQHKKRLFGLTIEPYRLHSIRTERRPNTRYASLAQCRKELQLVESVYKETGIPYIEATNRSIEEISTEILAKTHIKRRFF